MGSQLLDLSARRSSRVVVGWQLASDRWLVESGVLDGVERGLTARCGHLVFGDQLQLER
jgi:hypothetical protein